MATATRRKKRRTTETDDAPVRRKKGSSGGGGSVKLDLRKTERGKKGGHRYPEQDYKIHIDKAERKTAQSGNTQIVLHCTIVEPEKYKGKPLIDRVTLSEKAMFRVGWLLDACKIKWKNAVVDFPLKKLENKTIGVSLYDDEYGGRVSSKVSEYYTEEEVDEFLEADDEDEDEDEDEDDEDDEDEDDEDEDEDEDEGDEFDDMDRVALKKAAKKAGVKVTKSMEDDDIRDALREDDDEDEDEDLDELDDDDL